MSHLTYTLRVPTPHSSIPSTAFLRSSPQNEAARALPPNSENQVKKRPSLNAQTLYSYDTFKTPKAHKWEYQTSGCRPLWAMCLQARRSRRARHPGAAGWLKKWHRVRLPLKTASSSVQAFVYRQSDASDSGRKSRVMNRRISRNFKSVLSASSKATDSVSVVL